VNSRPLDYWRGRYTLTDEYVLGQLLRNAWCAPAIEMANYRIPMPVEEQVKARPVPLETCIIRSVSDRGASAAAMLIHVPRWLAVTLMRVRIGKRWDRWLGLALVFGKYRVAFGRGNSSYNRLNRLRR